MYSGNLDIPLSTMVNLTNLNISNNLLSGELPSDWDKLPRLKSLELNNNQFTGSIPASLAGLSALTQVNLSENQLTGDIPSFNSNVQLNQLNISKNLFTGLSGLAGATALVNGKNNQLDFGDFELLGLPLPGNIAVNPQDSLFTQTDSTHSVGTPLTIAYTIGGTNNQYQWLKDGKPLANETASTITITNPDSPEEGKYVLKITNSDYPTITLFTAGFNLKIGSLERDKAALLDLLANTSGFTPTNWASNNVLNNTWQGVTVENERVTKLELPGTTANHLTGEVPKSLLDMTGLTTINLSGHELKSFPNVSRLPKLTALNISNNRLGFQHIVPNVGIVNITYTPQKRYGEVRYDTLDAGGGALLAIDFMGTKATYDWKFAPLKPGRPFNDETVQTVGNTRLLQIDNLNFDSQGTYRVFVKHPDAPNLTLEGRNQNIMAKTNVFGNITKSGSPLTTGGEVFIYRQTPQGPFIKEDSSIITANGRYGIRDVVLGNFVIQVKPNRTTNKNIIQTYYISSETYKKADTLKLRDEIDGINIAIIDYTPGPKPTTGASIRGQLLSDVEDEVVAEDGSRVLARRKVRKAACSMRKFKSTGRDLQGEVETELAYYIETDDEGYFDFTGVEAGKYLLNIEFPGVPVDPNSEVEFEISEDKENQVFSVDALVTETGIVIEQEEILFSWKPYLKEITLYPNPTEGLLEMDYLVYRHLSDLKIQIVSMQGQLLKEQKEVHHLGKHNTKIDLTDLRAGMYFLVFTNEAGTFKQEMKVTKK